MALDEAGMAWLESLGRPRWLLVPSGWHRLDAPRYKARYPELEVVCPAGSRKRVSKVVDVDATYAERPTLGDGVELETLEGVNQVEGVLRVRGSDGVTLVFNDVIFNLPHGKGLFWCVYGRLMGNTGGLKTTTIARWFVIKHKGALRLQLERLAEIADLRRLVVAHGQVVDTDATAALREVAASL